MRSWLNGLTTGKRWLAKAFISTILATLPFYCLGFIGLLAIQRSDSLTNLFAASIPTATPISTATSIRTATSTPTSTRTPKPQTPTPAPTNTRVPTATRTPVPSSTPTPKPAPTSTPARGTDGRDEIGNFPVPTGFQLKDSRVATSGGQTLYSATWKGKSSLDKTVEFYRRTLPSQGWNETSALGTDNGAILSYTKESEQSVIITIRPKGRDDLEIVVILSTRQEPR